MAFPLFCPLWPHPGPLPVLLPLPAVPYLGLVSPTQPSDPQEAAPASRKRPGPASLSLDLPALWTLLRSLSQCIQVSVISVSFNTIRAFYPE